MARALIILGCLCILVGGLLYFAPWLLNWFGRLPGDIRIETEKTRIFIPITSMVIISIVLTVIVHLFRR